MFGDILYNSNNVGDHVYIKFYHESFMMYVNNEFFVYEGKNHV